MTCTPPGTIGPGVNAILAGGAAPFAGTGSVAGVALPPYTLPPQQVSSTATTMGTANYAAHQRSLGVGPVSRIACHVQTSSGNVCVGAYSAAGGFAGPGARIQTSGSVPCPAAGYAVIALGGNVAIDQTAFLSISADNNTAQFWGIGTTNQGLALAPDIGSGFLYIEGAGFPLPAVSAATSVGHGYAIALYGLP